MNKRTFLQRSLMLGLFLNSVALLSGQSNVLAAPKDGNKSVFPKVYQVSGRSLQGENLSLAGYSGKFVLVTLWATWCPTCRKELPLLRNFYADNHRKGFEMLALSVDEKMQDVSDYARILFSIVPKNEQFPILWRPAKGHQDNLGPLAGTPTHFIFDREGKLFRQRNGPLTPEDWDDLWTELGSK